MRKGSVLITGANGGLGSAFVSQFTNSPHARSHHGLYLVRDAAQAHTLKETLKNAPRDYTFTIVSIDLSSLFSVCSTASTLNTQISSGTLPPIRALILNAAVQHTDGKALSKDGFESHFAVNYLANFLFVLLMLPSMDKQNARIIGISSAMHDSYHWMNSGTFLEGKKEMYTETAALARGGDEVEDTSAEKKIAGMRRYGTSKLLLVMFINELQRRINLIPEYSHIAALSLDPGAMGGPALIKKGSWMTRFMWGHMMPVFQNIALWMRPNGVLRTNSKSATDLLRACFDAQVLGVSYLHGSELSMSSAESRDLEKQSRLWKDSVRLLKLTLGDCNFRGTGFAIICDGILL